MEHQIYLKSKEALQKENRSLNSIKVFIYLNAGWSQWLQQGLTAGGAASPAPLSQDDYYRLVPRLSHLFPAPLKWETMVIPLSQNT